MSDLLPCPFCGSHPELSHCPFWDGTQIACRNLSECAIKPYVDKQTDEEAIAAWNRRARNTEADAKPVAWQGLSEEQVSQLRALGPNWDGYGANAPRSSVIDRVIAIAKLIAKSTGTPEVSVIPNGTIALVFDGAEIEIGNTRIAWSDDDSVEILHSIQPNTALLRQARDALGWIVGANDKLASLPEAADRARAAIAAIDAELGK